jgi:hypothetical protein
MPYIDCVQESLDDHSDILSRFYTWETVEDSMKNPLYAATENVEKELLSCPDALTNETQIRPLLQYSNTPFIVLRRRDTILSPLNVTPKSKRSVEGLSSISPAKYSRTEAAADVSRNLSKVDSELSPSPKNNKKKTGSKRNTPTKVK